MAKNWEGVGCFSAIIIFVFIAWLRSDPDKPRPPPTPAMQQTMAELAVERSVKAILRDPDSATFRHGTLGCGIVNARNGFGGYTGWTRFMANPDADAAIETPENSMEFDRIWQETC